MIRRLPPSAIVQTWCPMASRWNEALVADCWSGLLRMAGSLKYGQAATSLIAGKWPAASWQNTLVAALKEWGMLRRTIHAAQYLSGPGLPQEDRPVAEQGRGPARAEPRPALCPPGHRPNRAGMVPHCPDQRDNHQRPLSDVRPHQPGHHPVPATRSNQVRRRNPPQRTEPPPRTSATAPLTRLNMPPDFDESLCTVRRVSGRLFVAPCL
jgi:Tn3 transposase DDE domain